VEVVIRLSGRKSIMQECKAFILTAAPGNNSFYEIYL